MKTSRIDAATARALGYTGIYGRITSAHAGASTNEDGSLHYFISINIFDGNRSVSKVINYMEIAKTLLMQNENEVRAAIKSVIDAVAAAHRHNNVVNAIKEEQKQKEDMLMEQALQKVLDPQFNVDNIEKVLDLNLKLLMRRNNIEDLTSQIVDRQLPILIGRKALVWVLEMTKGMSYIDIENGNRFSSNIGGFKAVLDSIVEDDIDFDLEIEDESPDPDPDPDPASPDPASPDLP